MADPIFMGRSPEGAVHLLPRFANRHGLIAGATGTGKTVSLQVMAEAFSAMGVPCFLADVKGDLAGLGAPGGGKPKLEARAQEIGLSDYRYEAAPVVFWDVFGEQGHPLRTTISEMGPILLSRLLELTEAQEGVLNIAFKIADEQGLLLLDLADLRSMLVFLSENAPELRKEYGNVNSASVGAIQSRLLVLEQQGGDRFFGEPALELGDLFRTDPRGRGVVHVLAADKLFLNPRLYSTVLLWLLAELFEELPEVGDLDKPKMAFFFDEAHLLFDDAPKALVDKVEQVVRLIRSKGIGVYFITQSPIDMPDAVLAQLATRIQHALRAFTAKDLKAVKATAENFRANPNFSTSNAITELGVGEALVSALDEKGVPTVVQRTLIRPPMSRLGPLNGDERASLRHSSPIGPRYDTPIDRVSAHEVLSARAEQASLEAEAAMRQAEMAKADKERAKIEAARQKEWERQQRASRPPARRSDSLGEALAKTVVRTAGNQITRQLVRGILGGLFKGR
jgi:DNA helicase HerA-like ATPase